MQADLGATVIKIEGERGSGERFGLHSGIAYHSGKQSMVCDFMNDPDERETFEKLLATADVLVENYRPGVMASLSLGWEDLHKRWPSLIMCSISAYGNEGPNYSRPGMDIIVQAGSGIMAVTGNGEDPAILEGLADMNAGLHATIGIQGALFSRTNDGEVR